MGRARGPSEEAHQNLIKPKCLDQMQASAQGPSLDEATLSIAVLKYKYYTTHQGSWLM